MTSYMAGMVIGVLLGGLATLVGLWCYMLRSRGGGFSSLRRLLAVRGRR